MKSLRKQQGFTIIEVMIVLVIAAVILLIVFLAVPALQRNSRNTQRKNDVANLNAAIAEFASNHSGKLPNSTEFTNDVLTNVKLGFYDTSEINWSTAPPLEGSNIQADNAEVWANPYSKCNGTGVESASSRQFSAIFNLEKADGLTQPQCQEG